MGSLETQSPLLYHWHHLANTVAWEQTEIHAKVTFCWLRNQGLKAERLLCTLGVPIWAVCALMQAEIPVLPCSICRDVRQKEALRVSLALCQPCLGEHVCGQSWALCSPGRPLPCARNWECIHPYPNSSSMDTLPVHTEHFPKQGRGLPLFPATGWSERQLRQLFNNGEQGSRHFYWKEDLRNRDRIENLRFSVTGTLL